MAEQTQSLLYNILNAIVEIEGFFDEETVQLEIYERDLKQKQP